MSSPLDSPLETGAGDASESTFSVDEIERLYQQALEAVDAVANDLNAASNALSGSGEAEAADESSVSVAALPTSGVVQRTAPITLESGADGQTPPVGPEHVIEALLFVGGKPLTIKAIGAVLRGAFEPTFIESAIEQLRDRYAAQNRAYEIRLTDGGYCLVLRSDFEPERNRLYGFGPRHVRLSQETLEVLSLVAYRQPVSRKTIEEVGKRGAGSHLRQLLQRELIVLDRGDSGRDKDGTYRTSPRFLQLFGLRRLEELPQLEDIDFK